jgi:hypothetical protein
MIDDENGLMGESWSLHPILDVPEGFLPAVMFAIRDTDVSSVYRKVLQKLIEQQKERQADRGGSVAPELMRQAMLRVAWDSVFRNVPGNEVGLLFRNEGGQESNDGQEAEAPVSMVLIKSNAPEGRKWIVTRATAYEGKVVCWSVSFDARNGERAEVVLSEDNMITLEMP